MDYRALSKKEDPFEGLSVRDAKKLAVYFQQFAPVRKNTTDLFREYGYLPPAEGGVCMIGFMEEMELMMEVGRELQRSY